MPRKLHRALAFFVSFAVVAHASAAERATVPVTNAAMTIEVDAANGRHPISPLIYGAAWANASEISTMGLTLNRWGGNAMSRYNWAFSTANRCKDYFFFNIPDSVSSGDGSNGKSADDFISLTFGAGAEPVMTIPMLSLLPKDRTKRCSYPKATYASQEEFSTTEPIECGNGRYQDGNGIVGDGPRILTTPDPNNTAAAYPLSHQGAWVQHMIDTHGSAGAGGMRVYSLDNEPGLWSFDHWDVHPTGTSYDDVWAKMEELGAILRAKDANAIITGGEEWGWSGYFQSGLDVENGNTADRDAHGGLDYYPWLLEQFRAHEKQTGVRILDVFTAHFYPQSGEFWSGDTSIAMQTLRNRSTRSLWDPAYVDESWIGGTVEGGARVRLIPRLREWVRTHYPGTKIGITEYNWGDGNHINYGTAQADILGIFGRERLDVGIRWESPEADSFAASAFRMYRNYDGAGAKFGDVSVRTTAPTPDELSAFSSIRSADGALTVMLVNKTLSSSTAATVNLANFTPAATIQRWELSATNVITRLTDLTPGGSSVVLTLPAQTVTLLVIPPAVAVQKPALTAAASGASRVVLQWTTVPGATGYDVYRSTGASSFALLTTVGVTTTLNDDAVVANTTYLYLVRARSGGGASDFSNVDAATTVDFTDPTAAAGTVVKAVHFLQLRTAVNAMRAAAGLSAATFAESLPGNTVKAVHVNELRTALDIARDEIGLPAVSWTDRFITGVPMNVKALHLAQLRSAVN